MGKNDEGTQHKKKASQSPMKYESECPFPHLPVFISTMNPPQHMQSATSRPALGSCEEEKAPSHGQRTVRL